MQNFTFYNYIEINFYYPLSTELIYTLTENRIAKLNMYFNLLDMKPTGLQ